MWVRNNRGKLGEELGKLSVDLAPDGPSTVLLLGRGHPAGHDVVGINLGSKAMEKGVRSKQS